MPDRLDDLLHALGSAPVPAPPYSDVLRRGDQRRTRARVAVTGGLVAVVLTVAGAAYGLWDGPRAESLVPARPVPSASATASPTPEPPSPTATPTATPTPAAPPVVAPPGTPHATRSASPAPVRTSARPTPRATTPPATRPPVAVEPVTRQLTVTPVTSSGQLKAGYTIQTTVPGRCTPISSMASGGYDCFEDGSGLDKACFSAAGALTAYCLYDPYTTIVRAVTVASPLAAPQSDPASAPGGPYPWALRLADGSRCIVLTGAHGLFQGRTIDYTCDNGSWVLRSLDQAGPTWHGDVIASVNATTSTRTAIVEAVYGPVA